MKKKTTRSAGRPPMEYGKRSRKIDVRLTEEEFSQIVLLEKTMGLKRTDIVRMRILQNSAQVLVNARDLMTRLDQVGVDLGRASNNINQLARYANTLNKRGLLSPQIIERFNQVMQDHNQLQQLLEIAMRKVIRSIAH